MERKSIYRDEFLRAKQRVDSLYKKNAVEFDALEKIFSRFHQINPEIFQATVKQRILGAFNDEISSSWISGSKSSLISFAKFYSVMGFLLLNSIIGVSTKKTKTHIKILFDCVGGYEKFYSDILCGINKNHIAIWRDFNFQGKKECSPKNILAQKGYSKSISFETLKIHFKLFSLYSQLSKSTNLDLVDLVLRLLRQIIVFRTSLDSMAVDVFISSHDNGFTPLRYQIYKNAGIKNIILIQNGGKVELLSYQNSYIHSDYFFGWTKERLDTFFEMNCAHPIEVGSVLLDQSLCRAGKVVGGEDYHIALIEQIYPENDSKFSVFIRLLKYIRMYSLKYPDIRVLYLYRSDRNSNLTGRHQIDKILKSMPPNVLFDGGNVSSYDGLLSSGLVVSVDSSMRHEAIMMGIPVLSISTKNSMLDFITLPSKNYFKTCMHNYGELEERLNFLLNPLNYLKIQAEILYMQGCVGRRSNVDASIKISQFIKEKLSL